MAAYSSAGIRETLLQLGILCTFPTFTSFDTGISARCILQEGSSLDSPSIESSSRKSDTLVEEFFCTVISKLEFHGDGDEAKDVFRLPKTALLKYI